MQIDKFLSLLSTGFDVSFNYKNVFYTISIIDETNGKYFYGLGSDNGIVVDFESLESIPNYKIEDKNIKDIIELLDDEEIYY